MSDNGYQLSFIENEKINSTLVGCSMGFNFNRNQESNIYFRHSKSNLNIINNNLNSNRNCFGVIIPKEQYFYNNRLNQLDYLFPDSNSIIPKSDNWPLIRSIKLITK